MKELSRKTFLTIYGILTAFLLISLFILNLQNYQREFEGVMRNLHMMDEGGDWFKQEKEKGLEPPDLATMRIMDYEVYTVEMKDGDIAKIISHGNSTSGFDSEKVAKQIQKDCKEDTLSIGNLYTAGYSYHYKADYGMVITNNTGTRSRLRTLLAVSVGIFVVLEAVIVLLSRLITGWIVKPAKESFDKQKEFIADASHELKTPLAVIMASSDEMAVDDKNRKYIENIKYESERMNKLITGLLDLSKLENAVNKGYFKEENLSKIVEKTALTFEGLAFEQGVFIETEIEKDLTVSCSKEEMEKLTSTLLDNAIKHSDKSGPVKVLLRRANKGIVLKVENPGEPIPVEDEEKIFERFYRADKARSRSENRYGLGLAIAKSIVINHGGSIRAHSEGGKTCFYVELKTN